MTRNTRALWCCSGGIGLVLVIVLLVFLRAPSSSSDPPSNNTSSTPVLEQNATESVGSSKVAQTVTMKMGPTLPPLDFPSGSVEDACGLNEFPPLDRYLNLDEREERRSWINNPYDAEGNMIALETAECRDALEEYMNASNPVHFSTGSLAFSLIVLDDPLTFERLFADPAGDLNRVQNALRRPECRLEQGTVNWELKESCDADAFLNYALINRFCYKPLDMTEEEYEKFPRDGIFTRKRAWYRDNPTSEQDRLMWKQSLEDAWVRKKCEELDPNLEFTPEQYPELYELVMSFEDRERPQQSAVRNYLIEIAARLGDDTAGLTSVGGHKYGRFSDLLNSESWRVFTAKGEPDTWRFEKILNLLAFLDARRPDPRDEIEFDWEFVARHLCEPPYFEQIYSGNGQWSEEVEVKDHLSCKEIVHELRQSDMKFAPLLQTLDKFEQVALELDVYE